MKFALRRKIFCVFYFMTGKREDGKWIIVFGVKDAVMTIRLPEEVDHLWLTGFGGGGEILVERNVREVVFDFRKTVFMDSSGLDW